MIEALALVAVPERFTHDAPYNLGAEIVFVVEAVHARHHFGLGQMRILDVGQLVSAGIGERFHFQEALLGHRFMQFRAGHGMREGDLNRFAVQLFGEVDGLLNRLARFAGQTDDEVAVHANADFTAILHEGARHLDGRAFLDVLQNLRVARLKAHDEEPRAGIGHGFQGFVIAVHARGGRPAELQRLELGAQIQHAVLADVEGIVVEEYFLHLREVFDGLLHFAGNVFRRASAPRVTRDGLRPHAEGAQRGATARCVERNERMQEERNGVVFDGQVALVNVGGKRECVQFFGVQLRARRVVHNFAVLAIADT